jgi:hypothetical protein
MFTERNLSHEFTIPKSTTRPSDSEILTEKDITVSNFGGIEFLPDQQNKDDSPSVSQNFNFKKQIVNTSVNFPLGQFDDVKNKNEEMTRIVSMSTENKSFNYSQVKKEDVEKRLEITKDLNAEVLENSSLVYSCLASYVGYYFSEEENKYTSNSILNKCLGQGKINYPDLFLRFMD